jgi:hypothetical protein
VAAVLEDIREMVETEALFLLSLLEMVRVAPVVGVAAQDVLA